MAPSPPACGSQKRGQNLSGSVILMDSYILPLPEMFAFGAKRTVRKVDCGTPQDEISLSLAMVDPENPQIPRGQQSKSPLVSEG